MNTAEYIQAIKHKIDTVYSIPTNSKNGAVIVETRFIKDFGLIVKNHLYFLPKDWGLTVCYSNDNEAFVKEELQDVIGVNWVNLGAEDFHIQLYNTLLTSNTFWTLIPYKKALIFQSDSLLLRKGIEKFMEFDYVGAPWIHVSMPKFGGNGGLSLRDIPKTRETIRKLQFNAVAHGNEDVFFSLNMQGNIANRNMAMQFSVETIFFPTPIGVHAIEKWLTKGQVSEILTKSISELCG